jgi:hypothetical protein
MNHFFSRSVQADISGFNNLLKINIPYDMISPGRVIKIDHVFWNKNFNEIVIRACMHDPIKIYPQNELLLDKYKVFDKPFIPLPSDTLQKVPTSIGPAPCFLS